MKWNAYYRLMRLDKPIGIALLWYPTAWALWLANNQHPSFKLVILFFLGTVFMRSAGCVINDIADRHLDKHVHRTQFRPLTSGELHLDEALILLGVLLMMSATILLYLPFSCIVWAVFAALITIIYPFCKRFINAPQLILGIAFSMGIPMVYVASGKPLDINTIFLLILNFLWTVAYDTMYAMADKEDDLKIGIKSTAIYFAHYDKFIIGLLLWSMHFLWLFIGWNTGLTCSFYLLWAIGPAVLMHQQKLIKRRVDKQCFQAFLVSAYYGALMWGALFNINWGVFIPT